MLRKLRTRLTYANVMATIAVFIALGGGAYAVTAIPRNSVGTKQLKNKAVTPKKVAASTKRLFRGRQGPQGSQGPTGAQGAQGPTGPAGVTPAFTSTNGTVKLSVGQSATLWSHGPLSVTGTCSDLGGGSFRMRLSAASTEANSALYGTQGTDNPNLQNAEGTAFTEVNNVNVDLAAPSGAALDVMVDIGVHGLGADCWAHGFGIGQG